MWAWGDKLSATWHRRKGRLSFPLHMDSRTLKAVQVGCGSMGKGWVEAALKTPGLQLVGLVDLNRTAAEAMAAKFNLPANIVFGSLKEALDATNADVVFDVTVPAAHEAVVTE